MLRFYVATTNSARSAIARLGADVAGVTAIEYALIASGISIVIAGAVAVLGGDVQGLFSSVSTALK